MMERLIFELRKNRTDSAVARRPVLLQMRGTDLVPSSYARWRVARVDLKGVRTAWVTFPQSEGTIVTNPTGSWEHSVLIEVSTAGLREQSLAYSADVWLNVTVTADRQQDQIFVFPVQMYVSAEIAAPKSDWGTAVGNMLCPTPIISEMATLPATLETFAQFPFQACGALLVPLISCSCMRALCPHPFSSISVAKAPFCR